MKQIKFTLMVNEYHNTIRLHKEKCGHAKILIGLIKPELLKYPDYHIFQKYEHHWIYSPGFSTHWLNPVPLKIAIQIAKREMANYLKFWKLALKPCGTCGTRKYLAWLYN